MSTARRQFGPNEFGSVAPEAARQPRDNPMFLVETDPARSAPGEQAVPLFLSDPLGQPRPEEYGSYHEGEHSPLLRTTRVRPALVGATLALAALAGVGAAVYSRFAVAQAPAIAVTVASADPATLAPEDLSVAPQVELDKPQPIAAPQAASTPEPPSQDAMKAAYQNALQGQPPATAAPGGAPAAVSEPSPPVPDPQGTSPSPFPAPLPAAPAARAETVYHLAADQITSLLRRGDDLVRSGDVAAARLALRRAAEAGDASAMVKLGATYDPALLSRIDNHGVAPDVASARAWYEKAAQIGSPEARRRLDALARLN